MPAVLAQVREVELRNQEDRVISNRRGDISDSSNREDRHERSRPTTPVNTSTGQKGCNYKPFLACKPQPFQGDPNLVATMRWIKETKVIFKISKCVEEDKVTYATSMLKSEALFWWEIITNLRGEEAVARMTWGEFKVLFNEKFCPRTAIKRLEEEFLRLEQGIMTVREYTTSFTEKARFSKHYVSTEERRVERYIWGLKASIREFVLTMSPTTFQEAVNAVEIREKEMNRQDAERGQIKRKWEGLSNETKKPKFLGSEKKTWQGQAAKPCPKCNRVHKGKCMVKPRMCYRCVKPGHLSQDCKVERRE
ncbi:uncharacterized protein LOC112509157 [Cynara cardunculus var. scolymus]|uniref:uncharacterized protein LOC112509157 n=1 Tax=Cynara cardunculus var. scolymus TaxID=59895 RepID=UPI000D62829B|nr:uncharacterized protein LOC112509157 [Cynara cardunculus var. scolymus]